MLMVVALRRAARPEALSPKARGDDGGTYDIFRNGMPDFIPFIAGKSIILFARRHGHSGAMLSHPQ